MQHHLARIFCLYLLILRLGVAFGDQVNLEPVYVTSELDGIKKVVVSADQEASSATTRQDSLNSADACITATAPEADDAHEGRSWDVTTNGARGPSSAADPSSCDIALGAPVLTTASQSTRLKEANSTAASSKTPTDKAEGSAHISPTPPPQEPLGSVVFVPLGYEEQAAVQPSGAQLRLTQAQSEPDCKDVDLKMADAGGLDCKANVEAVPRASGCLEVQVGSTAMLSTESSVDQQDASVSVTPPQRSPQELPQSPPSVGASANATMTTKQQQPPSEQTVELTPTSPSPVSPPQTAPLPPQPTQPQLQATDPQPPQLQSQPTQTAVSTHPTTQPAQQDQQRKRSAHTVIPKPDEFVMAMPATELSVSVLAAEVSGSVGGQTLTQLGLVGDEVFMDGFGGAGTLSGTDVDNRLVSSEVGLGGPGLLEGGMFGGVMGPAGTVPHGTAAATAGGTTSVSQMNGSHQEDDEDDGRKINLAAASDGASIIAANKEVRRSDRLIDGDDDSYMKNACSASKWVIVELSQLGRVDEIKLTMKEMYSSRVREFQIKGRQSHPKKDGLADYAKGLDLDSWQLLGVFNAENRKGSQVFRLPRKARVRYLLLQVLSHYGTEEMCALNSLEVRGVTAAQELEAALSRPLNTHPPPSAAATPGRPNGAQHRVSTVPASQGGQEAATAWPTQGTGAYQAVPVPVAPSQEHGQQKRTVSQQPVLQPQAQHQQQQFPQQAQEEPSNPVAHHEVPSSPGMGLTAGTAGVTGVESGSTRGDSFNSDGASVLESSAGAGGGEAVLGEAPCEVSPSNSSCSSARCSSCVHASSNSTSNEAISSNSSASNGDNSSSGTTSSTAHDPATASGPVSCQFVPKDTASDVQGTDTEYPDISGEVVAPDEHRPQCDRLGVEAVVVTFHAADSSAGKNEMAMPQDLQSISEASGEVSCAAAESSSEAATCSSTVANAKAPSSDTSLGQSAQKRCQQCSVGLSECATGVEPQGVATPVGRGTHASASGMPAGSGPAANGAAQASGAGQLTSPQSMNEEAPAEVSGSDVSADAVGEDQAAGRDALAARSASEVNQRPVTCITAPASTGQEKDGASGAGDAESAHVKVAGGKSTGTQSPVSSQVPNGTAPTASPKTSCSGVGTPRSPSLPTVPPSSSLEHQQQKIAPVPSQTDSTNAAVASAPSTSAASGAAIASPIDSGLPPPPSSIGSQPEPVPAAVTAQPASAPPVQAPLQSAAATPAASVASAHQQSQAHSSLDSVLSMLDVGSSSKPRVAGNLFDVIKQEMMMLKLNQTRLWAYIHALVDALNARHDELEADAQAVENKLELLDASLATVTGQAVARASEASFAPLAAISARLAELEARAARAEAQAAAVLLYSSAVLGVAVLAGLAGGRWYVVRCLIVLLSLVNGAVALGLHVELVRVTLEGYKQAAAGFIVGLLDQAKTGAFGK